MTYRALLPALLLLGSGCSLGPIEAFDSPSFSEPPEIWERDGSYFLRVVETFPDPVGMAPFAVETLNGSVYVFIWGRHSNGGNPKRLFDLGIKATNPSPRFFWINPDQSRTAMEIVRRPSLNPQ